MPPASKEDEGNLEVIVSDVVILEEKVHVPENDENIHPKAIDIFNLFKSCRDASNFLTRIEAEMYALEILSTGHKPEPLAKLERMLYELASDSYLTNGVFYAMNISFKQENASSE